MKIIVFDMNNWFRRKAESSILGNPVRECFDIIQSMDGILVLVWDGYNAKAARQQLYPAYKATRNKATDNFYETQKLFREVLKFSKGITVSVDGFEGDDVVAAIVQKYKGLGHEVFIESNDADLGQLGVPMGRNTPLPEKPHYLALYKTIVGDPSDNIPGCKQFGKTSWAKLTDEQKDTIQQIVVSGFAMSNELIEEKVKDFFPKSALTWFLIPENRKQLLVFYQIVNFLPIPWEVIENRMVQGTDQSNAAYDIMNEYMI